MMHVISYGQVREHFFREVERHPENVDLIGNNMAVALSRYVKWPRGMTDEQIGVAMAATFAELNRRWEYAIARRGAA